MPTDPERSAPSVDLWSATPEGLWDWARLRGFITADGERVIVTRSELTRLVLAAKRETCPRCPHCAAVDNPGTSGHVRPSTPAMLLQVAAPHGALDRILRWVESLRGNSSRSTLTCTLVGNDGEWVQLLVHREPEVFGRGRRRPVSGGGLDTEGGSGVPSGVT